MKKTNNLRGVNMNKYVIKLDNKIISKRNTRRIYNYVWVRVVQREEEIHFYKNTGETIVVENCLSEHYPKTITLNGQKVNAMTRDNQHEKDSLCYGDYINHIDKSKTIVRPLKKTYVINECSKNPIDTFGQNNLLYSKQIKFSDSVDGVRTAEFFTKEKANV